MEYKKELESMTIKQLKEERCIVILMLKIANEKDLCFNVLKTILSRMEAVKHEIISRKEV